MCLILTVRLAESDAPRASEICRTADLPATSQQRRFFNFGRRHPGIIHIPGPAGGCGCSFLTDHADWDALTWDMIPSTLPRLAYILRATRNDVSGGFAFEALWAGELPVDECRVTIEELVALAERSSLGTKTTYLVE